MESQLSLEERIQRLENAQKIKNMMGKEQYYNIVGQHHEAAEIFALCTPGVRTETANWGVYEGSEGIERSNKFHDIAGNDREGFMHMHPLTTPVVEVDSDGKTGRAVWVSPGIETVKVEGTPQASWAWEKYGVDLAKEDGKWKFWHLHGMYGLFHAPYYTSWVDAEEPALLSLPSIIPPELGPDRPCSHPVWLYSPTAVTELFPVPPEPYETWDEEKGY